MGEGGGSVVKPNQGNARILRAFIKDTLLPLAPFPQAVFEEKNLLLRHCDHGEQEGLPETQCQCVYQRPEGWPACLQGLILSQVKEESFTFDSSSIMA